jgi:eight-cysteine-cluster-containing protein
MAVALIALALLPLAASRCKDATEPTPTVCLSGQEPLFARYEGFGPNACSADRDCRIGGCSQEVCAASDEATTCELIPTPRSTFQCQACACVSGTCRWVR